MSLLPGIFRKTMSKEKYNPEAYWDKVAGNIAARDGLNIIAGDDEPYYRYKRKRFLELFDTIDVADKKVLEIGSGPGGNLQYLSKRNCAEIAGVDISTAMIGLSKKHLAGTNIKLQKIDGLSLPFDTGYFDLVFTSTVLQHITDEATLFTLIKEICRVSCKEVIIFERIEKKIKGHETNLGRPVDYYAALFENNGFNLISTRLLPIRVSYYISGGIRKLFNTPSKKEGEPNNKIISALQNTTLPVTRLLDKLVPAHWGSGMLLFTKDGR
jgi:ubiquinone/menaquinone biosynthesis C-methylase UbiE